MRHMLEEATLGFLCHHRQDFLAHRALSIAWIFPATDPRKSCRCRVIGREPLALVPPPTRAAATPMPPFHSGQADRAMQNALWPQGSVLIQKAAFHSPRFSRCETAMSQERMRR